MSERLDPVIVLSESFLSRFGDDCGSRLPEVVTQIGLELVFRKAESYEGALLRIKNVPRGLIVINSEIREDSRKRFTIAHECGHFLLPGQQDLSAPCSKERIENWSERLHRPEFDANRFAAEILMPRNLISAYLQIEPKMDSVQSIASICGTSLTASGFRLIELTSFRAAFVWSQNNSVVWYKSSLEFGRWIRRGELSEDTFAFDCFKRRRTPQTLESVPASAWLFEKGLKDGARIWEHSVPLPNYSAVLSLLVIKESVEGLEYFSDDEESVLDPVEFSLKRKRWPSKK